ncbi:MAG: hypothetical protein AMS25_12085 [Gemmatimonas sp. SM23_52]|nr:MAG: hypothetical protein AMS25_12085 [Gemmatimonas sp. SM23_52]
MDYEGEETTMWYPPTRCENIANVIVSEVSKLVEGVRLPGSRKTDPFEVLKRLGVDVIRAPLRDPNVAGLFVQALRPTVGIHERYWGDPVAMRDIAFHELGHAILHLLGLTDVETSLRGHRELTTEEVAASHVERLVAFPPRTFRRYLSRHPTADNFDIAQEFGVTLDSANLRLTEVISSPFTRDAEMQPEIVMRALRKCRTRVQILASRQIHHYAERDPHIRTDVLGIGEIPILSIIEEFVSQGGPSPAKGQFIQIVLKRSATADVMFYFENVPLVIADQAFRSLELLPPPYGPVAVAQLLVKLNQPREALAILMQEPLTSVEAYCVAAEATKKAFPPNPGLDKAEALLRKALGLYPHAREPLLLLANVLIGKRRIPEAVKLLSSSIQDGDDLVRRSYYRGKAAELQSEFAAARLHYMNVTNTEDAYHKKAGLRLAGVLEKLGREKEAEEEYKRLLRSAPYNVKALRHFVEFLIRQGQHERAMDYILRLQRFSPLQGWCYEKLGEFYSSRGQIDLAEPMLRQARILRDINALHENAADEWTCDGRNYPGH